MAKRKELPTKEKCLCGFNAASVTHSLLQLNDELKIVGHGHRPNFTAIENLLTAASYNLEQLPNLCGIEVTDLTQILDTQKQHLEEWQKIIKEEEWISKELGSEFDIAESIQTDLGKVWLELSTRLSNCDKMKQKK